MQNRWIVAIIAAAVLVLAACSASSAPSTNRPPVRSAVSATATHESIAVVGAAGIGIMHVSTNLFAEDFPVINGFGKVRQADPCGSSINENFMTPVNGCPFLATGHAWYSQLFPAQDDEHFCRIDPLDAQPPLTGDSPCAMASAIAVYQVDVYPILPGAELFAVRWAAAYFQCQGWEMTVKVGNTHGRECDFGENGRYTSYLILSHHDLIVVDAGNGAFADQFRRDFRLAT
jgi:hypothetical protein